ncbi:TetR/AcrR family transcriptional regulator [Actinoplanes sp. NPDC026619]|uniref:TetR/AcrR family transcriptional regulator n=1 Tax=Actinoplanes sp. NPDC026619 TaxID=3155798 RepID=UPI0033FA2D50
MPTGVALRDVREQLFAAAERVLLRDGPYLLTSRAVTAEAGVAKGVLHRHFTDFDDFLTELVLNRIGRVERQAESLLEWAGQGSLVANLATALQQIFNPVAVAMVSLITFRDDLRARLRSARGRPGIPLLSEAGEMVAAYLAAEKEHGRLAPGADVETLAPMVIGSGHLLFADRSDATPSPAAVERMVAAALSGAVRG